MLNNVFGRNRPETSDNRDSDRDEVHVVQRAAIFAVLLTTFAEVHPYCDHVLQSSRDARNKGMHGEHQVYRQDGVAVGDEPEGDDRTGWPTTTATKLGRRCAAHHVVTYTAGQLAASVAVRRILGLRVPWSGLLVGTVINAITHYIIDRRELLMKFLRSSVIDKGEYLDHCTVQRRPGVIADSGPGTGLLECDQAVHRLIGVVAALTTTWLAVRTRRLP